MPPEGVTGVVRDAENISEADFLIGVIGDICVNNSGPLKAKGDLISLLSGAFGEDAVQQKIESERGQSQANVGKNCHWDNRFLVESKR